MSDSSKDGVLALCGSMTGLSIVAVGLRFWARKQHKVPLMVDDWTATLALLSYIGASICVFIMVHNKGLGYSSSDLTPEEIAATLRTQQESEIALDILTNCTLGFVKLSALFFYRRIFCTIEKRGIFNIIIWLSVVVVVLWLFVFQFLAGFQCGTHFSALYDGTYDQYCTISFPFAYGLATSDFLLDVWILILPIPRIWQLQTTLQRKLSIMAVFLLALVGLAASIARMVSYIKVEIGGPDYLFNTDYNRLITQTFFYTMLECGMALVAVNLPSLRVLAISLKASELMNSMRSLFEFSFLRGSSSQIERHDLEAPRVHGSMKRSFSTNPSEGPEAAGAPSDQIPLHSMEVPRG